MATESTDVKRRIRRSRRIGGGMSTSNGTQAYGDVADDNPDLDEEVENNAEALAATPDVSSSNREFTPQNRMEDVRRRGGAYEREYRLQLLHRMLLRRVPLDEIARELDVSVSTIKNDRAELYRRLKDEAKNLDINKLIGDTLGFYAEVRGMSLRTASLAKMPMNTRLAALRTALSSKNDEHRFLVASGVFDVLRYRAAEDKSGNDITKLMQLTEAVAGSLADDDFDLAATMDEMRDMGISFDDEDEDIHLLG